MIRFRCALAEQTASVHLEVSAPSEVSILEASMLAGVPSLYVSRDEDPEEDLAEGGGRSSRDGRQSG